MVTKPQKRMNNGKYALVTGSGRGIGRALARELAIRGYNLALNSLPGENLSDYADELSMNHGINTRYYEIDLTSEDGPGRLYKSIADEGIRISILVNNAGTGIEGPLESYSLEDIDRIILLNIRALTILTFLFTPELKKHDSYLLNVSSVGSFVPTPYKSVYLASKAYITFFSKSLEAEFDGSSVKVCILAPGGVITNHKVRMRIEQAGWISRITSLCPEEVAARCVHNMFRGRRVVIPGIITSFLYGLSKVVPVVMIQSVTRRVFRHNWSI